MYKFFKYKNHIHYLSFKLLNKYVIIYVKDKKQFRYKCPKHRLILYIIKTNE